MAGQVGVGRACEKLGQVQGRAERAVGGEQMGCGAGNHRRGRGGRGEPG